MSQPLLSILIPITPDRKEVVQPLLHKIGFNLGLHYFVEDKDWIFRNDNENGIEVVIFQDNRTLTIGEKREKLYHMARGVFSWQIDSDDNIADNAIELIIEAIKSNPEIPCITFRESCVMNGVYHSSNHSIKYPDWADKKDGFDFVRTPFYKDVIRTDIARAVPFQHIRYAEDHAWSRAIKPLLTDEIHIDQELYFYQYETKPDETHEQRYGIKK